MRIGGSVGAAFAALGLGCASAATTPGEISPYTFEFSGFNFKAGFDAQTALFGANQPESTDIDAEEISASAMATLYASAEYEFASSWKLGLHSSYFIRSDHQAKDDFKSEFFQTVYGRLSTPVGRFEAGMAEGASAALAVTAPVADPDSSFNNSHFTFFKDPKGNNKFLEWVSLKSVIRTTANYAKLSYYSPELYGFQLGVSYTPAPNHDTIPFLNPGKKLYDLDVSFGEAAIKYRGRFGDFETDAYAGGAFAQDPEGRNETNHFGLTNWGFGGNVAYTVKEKLKVTVGGAFQRQNDYVFSIKTGNLEKREATALHIGLTADWDKLRAGFEYGDGIDGTYNENHYLMARSREPNTAVKAYGAALRYAIDKNLSITAGWQQMRIGKNTGVLYNNNDRARLDAVYVKLRFAVN